MQDEGESERCTRRWCQSYYNKTKTKSLKRKHMSTVYGDVYKPKFNLDLCTNPVGVPVICRVMLDPLRSRSLLAPVSTTRLSTKKCSSLGLDFLSLSFWLLDGKREPKNVRREKMKAFIGGFLGFECKEGQKSLIIKTIFFSSSIL